MKSVKSYFYKAQIVNIYTVAAMFKKLPKNYVFIFLRHFFLNNLSGFRFVYLHNQPLNANFE